MKNMTRAQRRRQAKIRKMLLSLSLVLVIGMAAVGGTIAWLTATTGEVTNTFTVGDINIKLDEAKVNQEGKPVDANGKVVELEKAPRVTTNTYKMIPGITFTKDPTVTVEKGSEACWLFLTVDASNWPAKATYSIDSLWQPLKDASGKQITDGTALVYYTTADYANSALTFNVLTNKQVVVSDTMTKADMDEIKTDPKLVFKAYAIQSDSLAKDGKAVTVAVDAWSLVK